jgi:hypothetical protein
MRVLHRTLPGVLLLLLDRRLHPVCWQLRDVPIGLLLLL